MKYILVIGDGMGDEPQAELGGRTPLAAADTPTCDRLAAAGEQVLVRTVPPGYPPGSDVANLSLLGYAPEEVYTGRAPLEAASMGVELADDEIAYRCNLVTLEQDRDRVIMRDYSAGHIGTDEAGQLIRAVQDGCGTNRIRLYPGISYRHLLVWKGDQPDCATTPPHDHLDQDVGDWYGNYLAEPELATLFACARKILADHPVNRQRSEQGLAPANSLWLWGEGRRPAMETMRRLYGIGGGLVSAVDLLKGLGVCAGLRVMKVAGATGTVDTNYRGKVEAALEVLADSDLVVVHLEGPDEAGHQGSLRDKVRAIERLDAEVVTPIVQHLEERGEEFRLVVCMDHYTPLRLRTHVDWPVPLFLYDSRGVANPCGRPYTEENAVKAGGGRVVESGPEFFRYFLDRAR